MDKDNKGILYSILLSVSEGDLSPEDAQKRILEMISYRERTNPRSFSGSQLQTVPFGLYEIYWKSGGSSLASVGNMYDGVRWIAPINWTSEKDPTGRMDKHANSIDHMVLLYEDNKENFQLYEEDKK